MDSKIRDSKLFRTKLSKAELERSDRSSNTGFLYENGTGPVKAIPPATLKESSSSLDYIKNPSMVIPPITQNSSIMPSSISGTPGIGAKLGTHNYRYNANVKLENTVYVSVTG